MKGAAPDLTENDVRDLYSGIEKDIKETKQ